MDASKPLMDATRDPHVKFQAILAGLPRHAVPQSFMRACSDREVWNQCGGVRALSADQRSATQRLIGIDAHSCRANINDAVFRAAEMYPDYADDLQRLSVEHASLDIVVLADHDRQRLYVAARGTDRNLTNPWTSPRDWNNNFHILFGLSPVRAQGAYDEYREVRVRFPAYDVYGSGHSLGGAVALQLARLAEAEPSMHFVRADIFDPAVSPFGQPMATLVRTDVHVHRVPYDWASIGMAWYTSPTWCQLHMHPVKPDIAERHSLKHFLPDRACPEQDLLRETIPEDVGSAAGDHADTGAQFLAVAPAELAVEPILQTSLVPAGFNRQWFPWATHFLSCVGARKPDIQPVASFLGGGLPSSAAFSTRPSSTLFPAAVPTPDSNLDLDFDSSL